MRIITNTKEPTSGKANSIGIGWNKTYFSQGAIYIFRFLNGWLKMSEYLGGPTNIRNGYIYGYFSRL